MSRNGEQRPMTAREWVATYGSWNRDLPPEAADRPQGAAPDGHLRGIALATGIAAGGQPSLVRLVRTLVVLIRLWRSTGPSRHRIR